MADSSNTDIERTLQQRVSFPMTMNDLRIIVNCIRAIDYWSEIDGESYLDDEGRKLKARLEAAYSGKRSADRRRSFEAPLLAFTLRGQ